jgi:subtilisin family serine protease
MILLFLSSLIFSVHASQPIKNPFEIKNQKWLASSLAQNSHALDAPQLVEVSVMIDQSCWAKGIHAEWISKQVKVNLNAGAVQSFHIYMNPLGKADLIKDSCVLGVGNYGKLSLHDFEDPMLKDQKHLESIGAVEIAKELSDGWLKSKVTLAVIDTGLDFTHPEFSELWTNELEAKGLDGVDDDKNGYVDDIHGYNFVDKTGDPSHKTSNDHGSHVAGLAVAGLGNGIGGAGVMGKNVQLMVLNVVGTHWDEVDLTDVEKAIRYAADKGADVINISSGGQGEFPTLAAAIVYAINKGTTIVVSAGNNQLNIDETFISPASYAKEFPGLISVGATDTGTNQVCKFSNTGKAVKITAPGCDTTAPKSGLLSTLRNSTYGYKKGTSMASPLAAGAVAIIYSAQKDKGARPTPSEVEKLLLEASTDGLDLRKLRNSLRN